MNVDKYMTYWQNSESYGGLPNEYTPLQCITSQSNAYSIDTGIVLDSSYRLGLQMMVKLDSANRHMFLGNYPGAAASANYMYFTSEHYFATSHSFRMSYGNNTLTPSVAKAYNRIAKISAGVPVTFELRHESTTSVDGYVNDSVLGYSAVNYPDVQYFPSSYSLKIFKDYRTSGLTSFGTFSLYFMKIYNELIMIRDYVPCIRNADNKTGLFDRCGSICSLTNTPFYTDIEEKDFTYEEF